MNRAGKITDQNMLDATSNGDGSGVKLAQWLFKATTGRELSEEDARRLIVEAQEAARSRQAKTEGSA